MKAIVAASMVTMLGLQALPAHAQHVAPQARKVASATDDLPLTPRFAARLSTYRDCVLHAVDKAPLADQRAMAQQAMSACAITRSEVQAQLVSDIQAQKPHYKLAAAHRTAETGMAQLEPMIEQAAIDWAHMVYVRNMR